MLVPSIGLRASQLVAGIAVVAGVAAEIYFTRKFKGKPLMVPLAMTAENKAAMKSWTAPLPLRVPTPSCRPAPPARSSWKRPSATTQR